MGAPTKDAEVKDLTVAKDSPLRPAYHLVRDGVRVLVPLAQITVAEFRVLAAEFEAEAAEDFALAEVYRVEAEREEALEKAVAKASAEARTEKWSFDDWRDRFDRLSGEPTQLAQAVVAAVASLAHEDAE
jgi:hypothetical protein